MYSINFVLNGSAFLRGKIAQYLRYNIPHIRADLYDMSVTIDCTPQDKETSFMVVTSTINEAFHSNITDIMLSYLEAAAERIDDVFPGQDDGDLAIMFRDKHILTEIQMMFGETVGYSETVVASP